VRRNIRTWEEEVGSYKHTDARFFKNKNKIENAVFYHYRFINYSTTEKRAFCDSNARRIKVR
jgi:hypothetical protein